MSEKKILSMKIDCTPKTAFKPKYHIAISEEYFRTEIPNWVILNASQRRKARWEVVKDLDRLLEGNKQFFENFEELTFGSAFLTDYIKITTVKHKE